MAKKNTQHASTFSKATSMPSRLVAASADDPRHTWRGASAEGVARLHKYLARELDPYGLYLTPVPEDQLRQVRTARFKGEDEYCRRTVSAKETYGDILAKTEFSGEDLEHRLRRCQSLDDLIVIFRDLLDLLQQTAHLEWYELIGLCDIVVKDIEAQLQRPVLDETLRRQLHTAAALPLETWHSRQADTQARKTENETLRAESDEDLRAQIAALQAQVRDLTARLQAQPAVIETPPPAPKKLASATPNRKGARRRDRSGE